MSEGPQTLTVAAASKRAGGKLRVAFVLPFGEHSDGFFQDSVLSELAAGAADDGHEVNVVRVYYDGRDPRLDEGVGRRLGAWLEERRADVVVLPRLFDTAPLDAHLQRAPGRHCVLVSRGDSIEPIETARYIVGAVPGLVRSGKTRRFASVGELERALIRLLDALARGDTVAPIPGVARLDGGVVFEGPPLEQAPARRPYRAVVSEDVIAAHAPPRLIRVGLTGNAGCPFAADPLRNEHYAGVTLPADLPIAKLGCAFCALGGDYEKQPDERVVADLVEQALFWTGARLDLEELVLHDQSPVRYLAELMRTAQARGVRPMRWLFPARLDSFVSDRARLDDAIVAAEAAGQILEVYLAGFETFSDAELLRYNKGSTTSDSLRAVTAMRELHDAHPTAFEYARARGHSLILWSPWTTPAELAESVAVLRKNGLGELFNEVGRNRLRLHRDLPIYYAAERDGALTDEWEAGDEGASRRKGYTIERPWRFLDPRTRLAYELAEALRDRLGTDTELAQLAAAASFAEAQRVVRDDVVRVARAVIDELDELESVLGHLLCDARAPGEASRGASEPAEVVRFAGACNNDCGACANQERFASDGFDAVLRSVDAARAAGKPLVLAGREPTLHPAFLRAVERARGDDARRVGVVSNGRIFADEVSARTAVAVGLRAASVKVFAPGAGIADAIARDEGAHAEGLAGMRALRAAGVEALELRAPLYADNLATAAGFAALAAELRVDQLRIEVALDAVGLGRLGETARAVEHLVRACGALGVAVEVSPLAAGPSWFARLVAPRRRG